MTFKSVFYDLLLTFILQYLIIGFAFLLIHHDIFKLNKKLDSFIRSNKFNNEKMGLDVEYVSTSTNQTCQELEIIPEITKVVIANEPEITTVISTFSGSAISTCLFIISIIICRSL